MTKILFQTNYHVPTDSHVIPSSDKKHSSQCVEGDVAHLQKHQVGEED